MLSGRTKEQGKFSLGHRSILIADGDFWRRMGRHNYIKALLAGKDYSPSHLPYRPSPQIQNKLQ